MQSNTTYCTVFSPFLQFKNRRILSKKAKGKWERYNSSLKMHIIQYKSKLDTLHSIVLTKVLK